MKDTILDYPNITHITNAPRFSTLPYRGGSSLHLHECNKATELIALLAKASAILRASSDYETIFQQINRLIVPQMADWFTVDLINSNGITKLMTVMHKNPDKIKLAKRYRQKYPINMSTHHGLPNVIKTGISELYPIISENELELFASTYEEHTLLKELGLCSAMIIPLIAKGQILGGIIFATTNESNKHYDNLDQAFAEVLSSEISMAIYKTNHIKPIQKDSTDHTITENELVHTHNKALEILENITDGFISIDKEWRFTYINSLAEKLLNCNSKDLIGKKIWIEFPVEEDSLFYKTHIKAMDEQRNITFEEYMPSLNKWFEVRDYPSEKGLSVYLHDITKQKDAERLVKDKEKRARQLFDSNLVGIIITSINGEIYEANEAFLKMTGYTLNQIKRGDITWGGITPEKYKEQDTQKLRELQELGIMTPWQKEYICADGSTVSVLIGGTVQENPETVIAFVIDINEQKFAEADRERLLQEKSALLDSTGEGILGVDLLGNCIFINKSAIQSIGFTSDEVIGKNIHKMLHHHYLDHTEYPEEHCPITQSYKSDKSVYIDNDFIWRKNDTTFPVEYVISPIKVVGEIVGTVVSFTDIALRKEKDNRKDEFLSMASHELKTPITTIKAFNQLLTKQLAKENNEKAVLYLKKMDYQLNKLTNLVQDLLDVSRIQAGKLIYNEEIFNISEMLKDAIADMQLTTQKHVIIFMGKEDIYIRADKDRINQVIKNLLANAIKYAPQSSKIIVKLQVMKDFITISVQDFGIGIPKSHHTKIFDRFYRINDAKRNSFSGLGIGLYISAEIIKRHHGTIWVESDDNKGSIFYVTLPKNAHTVDYSTNTIDRVNHLSNTTVTTE